MARKTGLGRGLDALIPLGESASRGAPQEIDLTHISRNPRQPRQDFPEEELTGLADSIRTHGIIQPLILSAGLHPDEYILIAGERRWLAARMAGLTTVPAIIREASEQQRLELALIENIQRTDLTPLEAAEAYHQLADEFELSHEEISRRVGKSRVSITNKLRLRKLPDEVKQALSANQISEGHARALLALSTPEAQRAALHTILIKDLSVRQTEELVRRFSGQAARVSRQPLIPPEVTALEERLRNYLGTRVRLNPRRKGGTLVIHYYSNEELDTLVNRIMGESESRSE